MINLIQTPLNLSGIPIDIRKYLSISDELLTRITVVDIAEPLVPMPLSIHTNPFWNDYTESLDTGEPEDINTLEGYYLALYVRNNPEFSVKVRSSVLERLIRANALLRLQGYQLSARIWYRPLQVQSQLFASLLKRFKADMPHLSDMELLSYARNYVSDPAISDPPHCTGGAIDVELLTLEWVPVNMGAPINHAGPESHITYDLLPADCFQARMLLCDTMLEVGFANLATEWWHFSYGDQIWAYFYGEESTLYWMVE